MSSLCQFPQQVCSRELVTRNWICTTTSFLILKLKVYIQFLYSNMKDISKNISYKFIVHSIQAPHYITVIIIISKPMSYPPIIIYMRYKYNKLPSKVRKEFSIAPNTISSLEEIYYIFQHFNFEVTATRCKISWYIYIALHCHSMPRVKVLPTQLVADLWPKSLFCISIRHKQREYFSMTDVLGIIIPFWNMDYMFHPPIFFYLVLRIYFMQFAIGINIFGLFLL